MDDPLACADLCEARGFPKQAELLRAIAGGQLKAYVVIERHRDEGYVDPEEGGIPRAISMDRDEAEREALRRNLRFFREHNVLDHGYLEDAGGHPSEADLASRIGAILGRAFAFPATGPTSYPRTKLGGGSFLPADATDGQIREIMELSDLRFFAVAEATFAG